jgi:SAM-dependent methyltransferase
MGKAGSQLSRTPESKISKQDTALSPERKPDWKATARQDLEYHRRQFAEPYRSTVALAKFVQSKVTPREGKALDVACGAGANIFHLGQLLKNYSWTGLDIAGEVLFPYTYTIFRENAINANLMVGDFYKLTEIFKNTKFDLVFSIQTLLTCPTYERPLDQLLAVTGEWLFVTGLFTDFNVDAKIEVMDYSWPSGTQGPYYYNVYGLERFRAYCEARGCTEFISQDFQIDMDLPPPETKGFGTYTEMTTTGRRLQFTGPIFQPWKFIAIRMGKRAS